MTLANTLTWATTLTGVLAIRAFKSNVEAFGGTFLRNSLEVVFCLWLQVIKSIRQTKVANIYLCACSARINLGLAVKHKEWDFFTQISLSEIS